MVEINHLNTDTKPEIAISKFVKVRNSLKGSVL